MNQLTDAEINALHEALDDEYHAWATYDQVITDFGDALPFRNIREAEARHIQALSVLFDHYDVPIPENPWPGKVERYPDLQAACQAGVTAEIANAELYDRVMSATRRPDILAVLRNLRDASQQRHLPAFKRWAQSGGECGGGQRRRDGGSPVAS
jgi:hypothetical protein